MTLPFPGYQEAKYDRRTFHVPLIISWPDAIIPAKITALTSSQDLAPTISREILGIRNNYDTYSTGMNVRDLDNRPWILSGDSSEIRIIASNQTTAFDKHGTLWAATYLDGLFTYTPSTGFRPFADQDAIGSKNVVCLAYDAGKDLLYAGTYGAGFSILSPSSRKVEQVVSQDLIMWVSALMIDKEGTLWLGTFNGPLCYKHELGKLWSYDVGNVAIQARVYCFCEAENGVVWIGTGEGLTACDRVRGTTRFYGEADGLPNNVVAAIREAADGTLCNAARE